MKATDLIQHLASQIAKNGDRDVYLASRDADQYHLAHESAIHLMSVQRMAGKQTQYLDAAKASRLGYDPSGAVVGIVIG